MSNPTRDPDPVAPRPVRRLTAADVSVNLDDKNTGPKTEAPPIRDVLILVGLTGAGKTAAVSGLAARGAVSAILPDRRELTDHVILPAMTGDPGRRVTDRIERFRLTAAFRDRHPGGMGDVLARLSLKTPVDPGWLIFDGVRGAAEAGAVARMPGAIFAVLNAPPSLRLARLCLRGDPFDQAALHPEGPAPDTAGRTEIKRMLVEHGVEEIMTREHLDRLSQLLARSEAEPAAIAAAASIVVEEARHYDPAEALVVLQDAAPERTVVIDTALSGIDDVADRLAARLRQPG
jgi:hypothetical protein